MLGATWGAGVAATAGVNGELDPEVVADALGLAFGRVAAAPSEALCGAAGLMRFAELSAIGTAFRFPPFLPCLGSDPSDGALAPSSGSIGSERVLSEDKSTISAGGVSRGVGEIAVMADVVGEVGRSVWMGATGGGTMVERVDGTGGRTSRGIAAGTGEAEDKGVDEEIVFGSEEEFVESFEDEHPKTSLSKKS